MYDVTQKTNGEPVLLRGSALGYDSLVVVLNVLSLIGRTRRSAIG